MRNCFITVLISVCISLFFLSCSNDGGASYSSGSGSAPGSGGACQTTMKGYFTTCEWPVGSNYTSAECPSRREGNITQQWVSQCQREPYLECYISDENGNRIQGNVYDITGFLSANGLSSCCDVNLEPNLVPGGCGLGPGETKYCYTAYDNWCGKIGPGSYYETQNECLWDTGVIVDSCPNIPDPGETKYCYTAYDNWCGEIGPDSYYETQNECLWDTGVIVDSCPNIPDPSETKYCYEEDYYGACSEIGYSGPWYINNQECELEGGVVQDACPSNSGSGSICVDHYYGFCYSATGNFCILDDAYWTEDILSNTCPPGYEYEYENAIYAYKSIAPAGKSLGKAQKPKVSSKQKISSKVLSAVSKIKQ